MGRYLENQGVQALLQATAAIVAASGESKPDTIKATMKALREGCQEAYKEQKRLAQAEVNGHFEKERD